MNRSLAIAITLAFVGCDSGPKDVTFVSLPMPVKGFQYKIPPFAVESGKEVQACYFLKIPGASTDEFWVDRYELAQTTGSHHMNIFRVNTLKNLKPNADDAPVVNGECFVSSNWSDWPLVVNTQQDGVVDWKLPTDVGAKFKGGELLMLQTHWVNATTQKTPAMAQVVANFHSPAQKPANELATMFVTNQNIRICPGDVGKSFTKSCTFPSTGVNIVAANGHFHSRGSKFEISPVDSMGNISGATFYTSTSWDDPPMSRDINVSLPQGGGIQWKCTFDAPLGSCGNPDDMCCFKFGGQVETSEHCNAFVYYWPKAVDVNCF
jgi:hypothetical protein